VEKFSIVLAGLQNETEFEINAGLILSALINLGNDGKYTVHAQHLDWGQRFLGYKNTKEIYVNGHVENQVGHFMTDGKIVVNGNAGQGAGSELRGGEIEISGNADKVLGMHMQNGKITVHGDVGEKIAPFSEGGEIHLLGKIQDPANGWRDTKARIFHKGVELRVTKGREHG